MVKINNTYNLLVTKFIISAIIFMALLPMTLFGSSDNKNDGIVLIIASYNPDTYRMSSFISDFETQTIKKNYHYKVLIEDLGCQGINEAFEWNLKMKTLLDKHKKSNIQGIILLGQEAWASFLVQDNIPENIPFFACFASENGIKLPLDKSVNINTWKPQSINTKQLAKEKGQAGGYLNKYNIKQNIELIKIFYPNIKNIAFVSDNTYGGVSLQALVIEEMKNFTNINLILIDSRTTKVEDAANIIGTLPSNTALLIGTWRVDTDGLYFLSSSIKDLISGNPSIPTFSVSGTGIGSVAVGGYIPKYKSNAATIADQIYDFHLGTIDSTFFHESENEYSFDKQMLDKVGMDEYKLPKNSIVTNKLENQLQQYRNYTYWTLAAMTILILIMAILYKIYYDNKKLKDSLIENEGQLIIAKERAEESDRLKSAFLANMSHEIRTPLNAIVGFSNLLYDESLTEENRREFSDIISSNSNLLLTLINDILDISRLETGKIIFEYKEEDINALCQQALITITHIKKPEIEYIFAPSQEGIYMLKTDLPRLLQVLINLVTNANKFTDAGTITIAYDVEPENNRVLFSISDTGCGIPEDMHSKVFDRFEKLDEHKQGTGLGLAICKQIVVKFGGDIWVDYNYKNGARFCFTHPINRD